MGSIVISVCFFLLFVLRCLCLISPCSYRKSPTRRSHPFECVSLLDWTTSMWRRLSCIVEFQTISGTTSKSKKTFQFCIVRCFLCYLLVLNLHLQPESLSVFRARRGGLSAVFRIGPCQPPAASFFIWG